jgi:hypothetical protein
LNVFPRLNRLAPGQLPPPHVESPLHCGLYAAMMVGYGIALAAQLLGIGPGSAWGWASYAVFWLALFIANRVVKPAHVQLGWMRTFRDLSRVLAGELPGHLRGFEVVVRDGSGR